MNVPKLRFGEFEGEWLPSVIGDLGRIITGKTPSTSDESLWDGDVLFITPTDIKDEIKYQTQAQRTVHNSVKNILPVGSILYTCIASIGKMCMTVKPSITNQQINTIIPNSNFNGEFVYYSLQQKSDFIKSTQANTTLPIINKTEFSKFQIAHPRHLSEQQKIADFLSAVDEKITALTAQKTALTQYKQGMMQRIFSQTLRFKDDNGADYPEWEEMRLGDLLYYEQPTKYLVSSTDYQDDYPTPVLTAGKTFILGYTDEQDGIFTNLPVIIFDDFTTANKFVNFPFKAKSSAMKMLKNDPKKSDLRFIYETMQLLDFATGDEHKRYWISEYQEQFIFVPCLEEQTKIAQFLTELDDKINAVDAQIQSAQQWKQGLLQQMFV